MEDLNKYMEKSTSSLSTIRSMVQEITDRKESYLSLDKVKILTATQKLKSKLLIVVSIVSCKTNLLLLV